jgi:hypothetical protein
MAAWNDTQPLFAGKSGAAFCAMTSAALIGSVNARTLFALAGDSAP